MESSGSLTISREVVEKAQGRGECLGVDLNYISLPQQHFATSPLESIFPTGLYPANKSHPQHWTWWVAKSRRYLGAEPKTA